METLPKIYEWTGPTGVHFVDVRSDRTGTYYRQSTPAEVVRILDEAQGTGRRLRLFTGFTDSDPDESGKRQPGYCWGDEYDTIGTISRSMGPHKIPLIIHSSRSHGGPSILDNCIVGIQAGPGVWLYRHPKLDLGRWTVGGPHPTARAEGYIEASYRDGDLVGQFKKPGQAARHCAFMEGRRWAK